jgi:probable H4MPT-linked C1 transfer pathway protein
MVIGWDIGGVNTKVACVEGGRIVAVRSRPYELQRDPQALVPSLRELAAEVGATAEARHAVTMTAELSQMFRTKRDGVGFVLDAVEAAFVPAPIAVFTTDGTFVSTADGRRRPLSVAAANWAATAAIVARDRREALLIDVGTTTTDIIPIVNGLVAARGRTDPARLMSGELVYTGAVRTPLEAIVTSVPCDGEAAGVSAEGFALAGDVHVWRGDLPPNEYSAPTPDGRPTTRPFAGERLARVVCGDREMLDDAAIDAIAETVATAQIARVADAIRRVAGRHSSLRTAVVTGAGAFVARRAAVAAGLDVVPLADALGDAAARSAPAAAVALLLDARIDSVDVVVKVGGALLSCPEQLASTLSTIATAARSARILVVPGGGPFADAVRDADRTIGLADDAAHWMAILAMDQYAHLLASRIGAATVVTDRTAIAAVIDGGRVPVLAPYVWLSQDDPLPHRWSVTSDSIAAWIAAILGSRMLVLVKAPGAQAPLVDDYFEQARPSGAVVEVIGADDQDALRLALGASTRRASV